jgi:hypothetical protein
MCFLLLIYYLFQLIYFSFEGSLECYSLPGDTKPQHPYRWQATNVVFSIKN